MDIQFDQKFYLLCNIRWSASRCIPYLSVVNKMKGEAGFLENGGYSANLELLFFLIAVQYKPAFYLPSDDAGSATKGADNANFLNQPA